MKVNDRFSAVLDASINFSLIYAQLDNLEHLREDVGVIVKTDNGILKILRKNLRTLKELSINFDFTKIIEDVEDWIKELDEKYNEKNKLLFGKPFVITKSDAEKLKHDVENWLDNIESEIQKPKTVLLKVNEFDEVIPPKLLRNLEKGIKNDIRDGFDALVYEFPTPAAMIFFRAAEGITRDYYEKMSDVKHSKLSWNQILDELENNQQIKKPLLNYLHYLRSKRNESAHPGKRFTQEDSERILLQIKGLLEELKAK